MKKAILFAIVLLLWTHPGWSQSAAEAVRVLDAELGAGARNLAMGGNGVATATDYTALYWNPAGLAGMRQMEFTGELLHLRFQNDASFAGDLSNNDKNSSRLRTLGLAVPLPTTRGSMVLAFGYQQVKDFDEYLFFSGFNRKSNGLEFELENPNGGYQWYPFDRDVEQTEEVTSEGGLHQWSIGGALALSPNFDVGLSMNFWRGREDYSLEFRQEDGQNNYSVYPADFDSYSIYQNIATDFSAFSLKMGGMFKLNRAMQVGMALQFPVNFKVEENYSTSDELVFDDGYVDAVEEEPGTWDYRIKTPFRFDAGIGVDAGTLKLTAGASYQDWSQTRFDKPDDFALDGEYSDLLSENRVLQKEYRETINYHLGGELELPGNNIFLRAGYAVRPSPLRDATQEQDRVFYSGGLGLRVGPNTWLDATYLRTSWNRESEDIYTPGGTFEDVTENRIFLGIRYGF